MFAMLVSVIIFLVSLVFRNQRSKSKPQVKKVEERRDYEARTEKGQMEQTKAYQPQQAEGLAGDDTFVEVTSESDGPLWGLADWVPELKVVWTFIITHWVYILMAWKDDVRLHRGQQEASSHSS